jgi:hypothetical protein
MMIAVAVAAGALGAERIARRSADFRERAEHHERRLATLDLVRKEGGYPYCVMGLSDIDIPLRYDAETAPIHAECVSYHSRLAKKYRRASWLPWLPVAPDPPSPYSAPVLSYFDYGH